MENPDLDISMLVDCMAQASDIAIEPEYRQAVVDALAAYYAGALLLLDFPMADDIEPAGTYEP